MDGWIRVEGGEKESDFLNGQIDYVNENSWLLNDRWITDQQAEDQIYRQNSNSNSKISSINCCFHQPGMGD